MLNCFWSFKLSQCEEWLYCAHKPPFHSLPVSGSLPLDFNTCVCLSVLPSPSHLCVSPALSYKQSWSVCLCSLLDSPLPSSWWILLSSFLCFFMDSFTISLLSLCFLSRFTLSSLFRINMILPVVLGAAYTLLEWLLHSRHSGPRTATSPGSFALQLSAVCEDFHHFLGRGRSLLLPLLLHLSPEFEWLPEQISCSTQLKCQTAVSPGDELPASHW